MVCSIVDPASCDSAIATVTVGSAVDAVDDNFGTITGGGMTGSVLAGDTLNGATATLLNVTVTPGVSPDSGLVMHADGTIAVAPTTPPGVYKYPYKICSIVDPLVCDSAVATVTVGSVVDAVVDDFGTVAGGSATSSVLAGDTLNGNPATLSTVTLTAGVSPNAGLLMNADGTISIALTTPAGTYSYPYTICSLADPTVCDTAIATLTVAAALYANQHTAVTLNAGSKSPSVLANHSVNGTPATLRNVHLVPGLSPRSGIVMNPDGTITVASDVPAGNYTFPYTICLLADPTVCTTGDVVLGVKVTKTGVLPVTGAQVVDALRTGALLAAAGAVLVVFARRRKQRRPTA
jgi:large repetitive protein